MPTAAFGHIAEAARDRKMDGFRWSTLTDRAPRAPGARRGGGQELGPRQAFRPEAAGLQAYLRGYSSNNTNPARGLRGLLHCLSLPPNH